MTARAVRAGNTNALRHGVYAEAAIRIELGPDANVPSYVHQASEIA